jgi:hypothetical protein
MKRGTLSHGPRAWCPSSRGGKGLYEEACAVVPQAGLCEGEALGSAGSNTVTLPKPKGGSKRGTQSRPKHCTRPLYSTTNPSIGWSGSTGAGRRRAGRSPSDNSTKRAAARPGFRTSPLTSARLLPVRPSLNTGYPPTVTSTTRNSCTLSAVAACHPAMREVRELNYESATLDAGDSFARTGPRPKLPMK